MKGMALCSLCLLTLLPFLTSCNDFLKDNPGDRIVLEKFWNEKTDVDNVLVSCYTKMQESGIMSRMMVWGEFRSDNIVPGSNINDRVNVKRILAENIEANNEFTDWTDFYTVINRCNTVMLYAPQVAAKDPSYTEADLKATIAEAKALRALCYFYLIRTFRDVPYVKEAYIDDSQEMVVAASSFDDILADLITDLEEVKDDAVLLYPNSKALYQTGRITRQAIYAMLCEMYLWKQDYQKCVYYADTIINKKKQEYQQVYSNSSPDTDGRLNGYPLELSKFSGLSYYGHAYNSIFGQTGDVEDADSYEVLFELVYMSQNNFANGPVNEYYGYGSSQSRNPYVYASSHLGIDLSASSSKLYNPLDARYYENIYDDGSTAYRVGKHLTSYIAIDPNQSTIKNRVIGRIEYAKNAVFSNWIIYRLSDIMLMKAEALVELGADNSQELSDAFELVQAVNNRSLMETSIATSGNKLNAANYTTKDRMRQLVLDERQRELMFEGKRWYDLVRRSLRDGNTNVLLSYVDDKEIESKSYALINLEKMDAIFWPYNLTELKVNKLLKQNPAFGSGEDTSMSKN